MTEEVRLETRDRIAVVTIDRPARRNAMTRDMLAAFEAHLAAVRADADVRALVVTGVDGAFCSGADLTAIGALGDGDARAAHERLRELYTPFLAIGEVEVPTLAAITGACVGGGIGLAMHCDVRVIADDAPIGVNFARLGIPPGLGISALLPKLVGYEAAAEMLFTGELLRGEEAARVGLVRRAVPRERVLPETLALAARIASGAPLAIRQMKRMLRVVARPDLEAVLELEAFAQAQLSSSRDAREGIAAILEGREPRFEGR